MDLKKIIIFLLTLCVMSVCNANSFMDYDKEKVGNAVNKIVEVNFNEGISDKQITEIEKIVNSHKDLAPLEKRKILVSLYEVTDEKEANEEIIQKAPKTQKLKKRNIPTQKDLTKKQYVKINLQDGDYVNWLPSKKSNQTAIEYHQNGEIMGFVKIDKKKDHTVFYEYRVNSPESLEGELKHLMISYHSKDSFRNHYIYTADGRLRVANVRGHIVAFDNLGMPVMSIEEELLRKSELATNIKNNFNEFMYNMAVKHDNNIFHDDSGFEGLPTAVALSLFSCYGGPTAFVIPPIMFASWIITEILYLPVGLYVGY